MVNRRFAAITSLALSVASVVIAAVVAVQSFPRGLTVLACLVGAVLAAWWALVHQGAARFAAAAGAGALLVGAVVLVVLEGRVLDDALVLAAFVLSLAAARRVFTLHARLPAASAPKRPVLFYNPKSGGGKAERFGVAREARDRGIKPVELHLGDVELRADLAPGETGREAAQHGELGRGGSLDHAAVSGIRSGRGEVLLDGSCDRGQPSRIGKLRDHSASVFEVGVGRREPGSRGADLREYEQSMRVTNGRLGRAA